MTKTICNCVLILAFTLSTCLSCGKCDFENISTAEHSGFGYASGLCFPQGEVEFGVYAAEAGDCSAILRCRCMHLNDAGQSLTMTVNGVSCQLELSQTTDWQELSISLPLVQGINIISFCRSKALFYDICIDYLEMQ